MNSNNSSVKSKQKGYWESRSKLEKRLIPIALLAGALLLTLVIVFVILYPNKPKVCTSLGCVRSSMEILNHIDQAVDPCDNFYKFACGTFIKNAASGFSKSVPDNMNMENNLQIKSILEEPLQTYDLNGMKAAKKLYHTCMNETAVEKNAMKRVKSIFREIGGWPTLEGNQWRENAVDWKDAMLKLRKMGILFSGFLEFTVEKDDENPTKHILKIDKPCSYHDGDNATVKELTIDFYTEIAVSFGAERNRARTDNIGVYDMLVRLSKVVDESEREEANNTKHISISELQNMYSSVHWFEFINGMLSPATKMNYDEVVLISPNYIQKLLQFLRNTSKRTISNFICIHILNKIGHLLPDEAYNEPQSKFLKKIFGMESNTERWELCKSVTFYCFPSVIAGALIERNYNQETHNEVMKLYSSVRDQFKRTVSNLEWMDATTKELIRQTIITNTANIVTKDDVYKNNDFYNVYNDISVYEDKLVQSVLNVHFLSINLKFEKLHQPVKNQQWKFWNFPIGFKMNYNPKENNIIIAAGLLQGIYFNKERPRYINYGTLGSVIAHEISYIFTDAENPTTNAKLRDKWSTNSLLNYYKRVRCITEQFSQFYVDEIDQYLNSSNTQDEDVADQARFKVSYEAYIKWASENEPEHQLPGLDFTPNQLFWISSAIPLCTKDSKASLTWSVKHGDKSPDEYKVIGGLRNLESFSHDFNCPVGSNMNPQEKCTVW